MRKFWYFMCACTVLVLGFCSCRGDYDEVDKRVALILPSGNTLARWTDDAKCLTQALNAYGYQTELFTAEETQAGAVAQVKQIEDALEAGYSHFVITPIDYNTINESGLLQAHPKCDFICYDRMIMNNEAVDFYATCDPNKIGDMQAQYLLEYFHASGKPTMTIEYFAGPATDKNASSYFNSAFSLLSAQTALTVPSGKQTYSEVALPSWSAEDAKAEMLKRLETIAAPDLILAPNDNVAEGIIDALVEKGYTSFPVITGQDMTDQAKLNIKNGRQAMTVNKEYDELARNAAMVVNSFILGNPVNTGKTFNNGVKDVPTIYSTVTLITKDNIDRY